MRTVPAKMWWIAALALTSVSALGSDDRFYSDMLQRGISDALRGANDRAVVELRIAAFGSIDNLPDYQRAEIHLTLACERIGRHDDARTAAQKAIQAERIAPIYGTLTIDPASRAAFEKLLPQIVGADRFADVAAFSRLARPAPPATASGKTPPSRPTAAQAAPQPVASKPQPQPVLTAAAQQPAVAATPKPKPAATATTQPPPAALTPAPRTPAVTITPSSQAATSVVTDPVATAPPSQKPPLTAAVAPKTDPVVTTPPSQKPPANVAVTSKADPPVATTPPLQPRPVLAPQPQTAVATPTPFPQPMSPLAAAARHQPSQYGTDFAARVADAQRLLNEGKMIAARQAFSSIAQTANVSRSALLDAARGLSETNAWNDSSQLYNKLFPLKRSEESHYFYEAINRYELGDVNKARELLTRALPFLPNTREVALYRGKIEGTAQ